jgi:hypothetical protein
VVVAILVGCGGSDSATPSPIDTGTVDAADSSTDGVVDSSIDSPSDSPVDSGEDSIADSKSDSVADSAVDTKGDAPDGDGAPSDLEAKCLATGGTVSTALCCSSASDFPNRCLTGACGCAPSSSHTVKVCDCPTGKCFNGTGCATG